MSETKKLFGTSGIRGLIGSEVTTELALGVGKALAKYLNTDYTAGRMIGYLRKMPKLRIECYSSIC